MAATFLDIISGKIKQIRAIVSGGTPAHANMLVSTDSGGKLSNTLLPTGVGPVVIVVSAGERLDIGSFIHITENDETMEAMAVKATASASSGSAKPAIGFVLETYYPGQPASIYTVSESNNRLADLIPGRDYYLSRESPGSISQEVPTEARDIVQYIGRADTHSSIVFSNVITVELA